MKCENRWMNLKEIMQRYRALMALPSPKKQPSYFSTVRMMRQAIVDAKYGFDPHICQWTEKGMVRYGI